MMRMQFIVGHVNIVYNGSAKATIKVPNQNFDKKVNSMLFLFLGKCGIFTSLHF